MSSSSIGYVYQYLKKRRFLDTCFISLISQYRRLCLVIKLGGVENKQGEVTNVDYLGAYVNCTFLKDYFINKKT